MSGAQIAAEVAAGIREAGAATGNGVGLAASILRQSAGNPATYPPTAGTVATFACTVVLTNYGARDRDGTQITARDVKVLVSPDAQTDPRNGDRLEIGGQVFDVVDVQAVQPGGVVLMWRVQARAANG